MNDSAQQEKHAQPDLDCTTQWLLPISDIQPYERNPRHGRNPEYDRIKDSIRSNGLDQPLVITQRPGAADYIAHAGGNTRLLILKELYEETGDARFARVPCLLRPWNRESDVLLAHLRENDLRGSLTFIDKAQAVFEAKQLLEAELSIDSLSQRHLETLLRDRGYSLSRGLISKMGYAVHHLLPIMPEALHSGLGRPQVERIRALDRAAREMWMQRKLGDEASFDAVFATLCARYDGPDWDLESLRRAIETEIAEALEVSIHTVRVDLDAHLLTRGSDRLTADGEAEDVAPEEEGATSTRSALQGKSVVRSQTGNDSRNLSTDVNSNRETAVLQASSHVSAPHLLEEDSDERTDMPIKATAPPSEHSLTPSITLTPPRTTDLKSLRARAWTLAARLAQRNGLGELVAPLSGLGLGYILRDVPDPALVDQLDADMLGQLSMLWWHLAACAEMTVAPVDAVVATLADDSILRQALENQDAGLLFNSVWTLDPGHTGYRLWRSLGDKDWQDLLDLMATYRHLHRVAADTYTALWDAQ